MAETKLKEDTVDRNLLHNHDRIYWHTDSILLSERMLNYKIKNLILYLKLLFILSLVLTIY